MPAPTVGCPACQALLVLKNAPGSGVSFSCPRCGARVPSPCGEADPAATYAVAPDEREVVTEDGFEEVVLAEVVEARRPRPGDPGARGRPPQRRKRRRPPKKEALSDEARAALVHLIGWPACLAGVGFLYLSQYLIFGTHGLPDFRADEPAFQVFLLITFVVAGALGVFLGINGIANQEMTLGHRIGWFACQTHHSGTEAVVLGVLHCLVGVFMFGVGLYGLRFHTWRW
ncbi:MAG TPA: hypothetical protein VJ739_09285 [Gemmataceae bacterium]|nr:hypothetical protein [Gemmataceae bacterium]